MKLSGPCSIQKLPVSAAAQKELLLPSFLRRRNPAVAQRPATTPPPRYTERMHKLRAVTKGILDRVEEQTGKSIQFLSDEKLSLLATLQMARNGADYHVLRYRPSNESLDYLIAFQAGFVLRLFENEPAKRFDFAPEPTAGRNVEALLSTGQALTSDDKKALPEFAKFVAQWALMNLRSLPIGMRIDTQIAAEYPELRELQLSSLALQQQQNMDLLSFKLGKLTIPTPLMGAIAAYALFADRLAGTETYAIPFEAAGVLDQGRDLLSLWDTLPSDARHDCGLVDAWAAECGMTGWFRWIPYIP